MQLLDLILGLTLAVVAVACGVLVLGLFGLAGSLATKRVALTGTEKVRDVTVTDVTAVAPEMPREVAECARALEFHGFRRLGAMSVKAGKSAPLTVWLMVDRAGIHAQLVDRASRPRSLPTSLLWLISTFRDGAALETAYLRGVELKEPDLHLQVAPSSVEDAVTAHRRSVERFEQEHGDPVRLGTMAEYLKWEADHRQRFGEREARALIGYMFDDTVASLRQSVRRMGHAFGLLGLTVVILLLAQQI